jgi:predicted AlkP superfamily phosphohydrolase/phosphomutase
MLACRRMFWYTFAMSQKTQTDLHKVSHRRRMVILGLDGLSLSMAVKLCATGRFPHLSRLALAPECGTVRAELPELSPVNWTSFYTGCGPEDHGIFGFTRISPASYQMALVDFSQVAVPTIFDRLGDAGYASRLVNLPNTYPVRPVKGAMTVAGFVAPELSRAVHPPFLAHRLREAGYLLEADTTRGASDLPYLLAQLRATLQSRRYALELFWPDLGWDVFTIVLTETDRLFHFFYDAVTEPDHPQHEACMVLLQEWDALIGRVLELYDALPVPGRLMALADHGFTRLITEVDINAWLRQNGYLYTQHHDGATAELDATGILPETRAFALDPGRIYLHTAQRFGRGRLTPAQAEQTMQAVTEGLLRLTYNGQPVIKAVHTADSLYNGPLRDRAPDIVCEPHDGFDLKAKFDRTEVFGFFGRTGTHTADGAFFYDSMHAAPQIMRHTGRLVLEHFGLAPVAQSGRPAATGLIHPPGNK